MAALPQSLLPPSLRRMPAMGRCALAVVLILLGVGSFGAGDASAAVTYRSSSTATDTAQDFSCLGPNATAAVTKPAGTANGDMMIATVAAAGNGTESVPAGWVLLAQNTTGQSQKVYWNLAGASEPASYTFVSAGFCAGRSSIVVSIDTYAGVDPTQPFTAGASTSYAATASLVMPTDTALEAGSMRVSSAAAYKNNTTLTTTGWSAITPATSRNVVYSLSLNVASAYQAQGAGATASSTATLSQSISNGLAYTVVLRPVHSQKVAFTTQPVGGVAEGTNFATQPTVAIQFSDSTTNTSDTSNITLAKASGPAAGVLSCTGGLTKAAVAGVAAFTGCQITGTAAVGTYTIQATSPGLTSATSSSFTIVVGTASKLAFTTQPVGNVNEGVNWSTQPSVTVRDAYDNNVTGDTGNVTLGIASGPASGAVTGCTANPKAAVSGVAAFTNCKITGTAAAGAYTLSATRAGLTTGTSATFVITVGAANKLGFVTEPGGAIEGADLAPQPAIAIQDSYGNTVTLNTSTVTIAKASGPGAGIVSCTGGLAKAAVSGVATFAGCQITGTAGAGTYTLSATGSFTATTSASFIISAGAAAKLSFTTQPVGGVNEGVGLQTQPAVTIQDAYSNPVTTDNTTAVTLVIASGPGSGVLGCTANPRAATSGVATFAGCQITGTAAAGTYTLQSTATGLTASTSLSFTITVGAATKVGFTTQPVGGVAEGVNLPTQPGVSVQDAYGNTVTGNTSTVTLAIATGPGSGVLSCTGGLGKAAVAGVSTFVGCQITGTAAVGTYTVTATNGALTPDTSASFTIIIGPAAMVVFSVQPVGGVAEGVALPTQPEARVRDAYGNTVTSDTSTITLSIASGPAPGVLSCTGGLAKAATAGVATFAGCQITGTAAAGTYTLGAADGALTPATSSSFVITFGVATKLAFTTQPVGGVPEGTNLPTQPRVSVQDAYSNTVASDTSSVSLAIASGPAAGVLGCTTNPRSATAGLATFAGCQITGSVAAGTYTFTATDGALTLATSSSFIITVGPANKLAFTTQPVGGVSPSTALPTQPTVVVRDAYNNLVSTDTSTVTLAVASGPGTALACSSIGVAATAGSATFAGCRIDSAPGTYTLQATDGALTSATSSSFVITAGTLALSTSPYAFNTITLNGLDQTTTATLPLRVADTTGAGAGWRVSASATGWTGGTQGSLALSQRVSTPPAATCDNGTGSCALASTGAVGWPLTLSTIPTVVYRATAGTGLGPQTVNLPMSLPIPGSAGGLGAFSQQVTVTVAAGP